MAKTFQFGKSRAKKIQAKARPKMEGGKEQEPPLTPIQGMMPASRPEWRVAMALNKLKIEYDYQYSYNGGRRTAGGQVIDFMAYTAPLPTPIYVQGDYWHRGAKSSEDSYKQAQVIKLFHGQVNMPLLVWEHQVPSIDAAFQLLRRELLA